MKIVLYLSILLASTNKKSSRSWLRNMLSCIFPEDNEGNNVIGIKQETAINTKNDLSITIPSEEYTNYNLFPVNELLVENTIAKNTSANNAKEENSNKNIEKVIVAVPVNPLYTLNISTAAINVNSNNLKKTDEKRRAKEEKSENIDIVSNSTKESKTASKLDTIPSTETYETNFTNPTISQNSFKETEKTNPFRTNGNHISNDIMKRIDALNSAQYNTYKSKPYDAEAFIGENSLNNNTNEKTKEYKNLIKQNKSRQTSYNADNEKNV